MAGMGRERFVEIVRVLSHYGFGMLIDSKLNNSEKSPENLRKAIEELGPTFIKIGQILSTRRDLIPESYIHELEKLQDAVPVEDFSAISKVFEKTINKKIDDCFLFFDEIPIASASVAQVYQGILKDGTEVVVKIQRPDIYEKMKLDIRILRRLLKLAKKATADIKVVDPVAVLDEIEETTKKELNFINEGENIIRFHKLNDNLKISYTPKLIKEFWSTKVLTLEKINGIKINDSKKLQEFGYDTKDIAKKLALFFCKQIFEDGFFHGDPHPGNILIYDGKICLIDFGITVSLENELRIWLRKAMFYMATKDKEKTIEFIYAVGIKTGKVDKGRLYHDITYLFDTYLNTSLKNIKLAVLIQEILNICKNNNIQLPREVIMLAKTLLILEGVIEELDPEIDISSVLSDYIKSKSKDSIIKELGNDDMMISAYQLLRDSVRIPGKTLEVLNNLANGSSVIKLSMSELDKTLQHVHHMVNRVVGAILVGCIILGSSWVLGNNVGPKFQGLSIIGLSGYLISTVLALFLVIKMIKAGSFRHKDK